MSSAGKTREIKGAIEMGIGYVLYNTMAGTKNNLADLQKLEGVLEEELRYVDIQNVGDYRAFFAGLEEQDFIILSGGDGTLNRFVNDTDGVEINREILYFPNGTGNDFAHDLGKSRECAPFSISEYLKDLPVVEVNGKRYRFLNGVGYGIDGYCCQVGDELKKIPGKNVNYTAIAIKGLLFHYKPTCARVTVDCRVYTYKNVWLVPTMNGRYYGGGMMPTPNQTRNGDKLSAMVFHGASKLRTLMIFPSIFNGKHVKHSRRVTNLEGREITVEFDRPTALQIDGETILNVASYTAMTAAREKEKADALCASAR